MKRNINYSFQWILIVSLMIFLITTKCQSQIYDAIWPFGYGKPLIQRNYGISYLDFRGDKVECKVLYDDKSFYMESSGSFICDKKMNLALVTNNCTINDNEFNLLDGGDTITPGDTFNSYCNDEANYPSSYSSILFPDLSNDSVYYMIHKDADYIPDRGLVFAHHLYLEIIVQRKDSSYYVKEKIVLIEGEFQPADVTAVMNKKGNKWWVTITEYDNGVFHNFLIGGDQVYKKNASQAIGDGHNNFDVQGQLTFSPDGQMMAVNSNKYGVMLYDFDNETGMLSNYRTISYPLMEGESGLMFSPNSRFLYIVGGDINKKELYQADLNQNNEIIKIAEHRSVDEGGWPVSMGWMFIGPDCRIYISPHSTTYYLHVIHHPNRKGLACGFEPNAIRTPTRVGFDLPNIPMYRFNGQCDSTIGWGITGTHNFDYPKQAAFIDLYPNPVQNELSIGWKNGFNWVDDMSIHFYNTLGDEVKVAPILNMNMSIDVALFTKGLYIYTVVRKGHVMQKGKIVVE